MSDRPLIHYWGPPGAGRATTLGNVIGTERAIMGDQDYHLELLGQSVVVRYSSKATKFFYEAEDPVRPDVLRTVIERLSYTRGIVFVADSQSARREHNIGSLKRLRADLLLAGRDLDRLPVVFQLNKRDLPFLMSAREMQAELQTAKCEHVESVATNGVGTRAAIERLITMVVDERECPGPYGK